MKFEDDSIALVTVLDFQVLELRNRQDFASNIKQINQLPFPLKS